MGTIAPNPGAEFPLKLKGVKSDGSTFTRTYASNEAVTESDPMVETKLRRMRLSIAEPDYDAAVLRLNPAIYWKLEETSGGITDASGNNRGGSWISGTTAPTRHVAGPYPGTFGVRLNGTTNGATGTMATATAYSPFLRNTKRTFMGWIKHDPTQVFPGIYNLIGGTGSHGAGESGSGLDFPVFEFAPGSGSTPTWRWYQRIAGGFPLYTDWIEPWHSGEWVHWALTVDDAARTAAEGLKLYINGYDLGIPPTPQGSPGDFWPYYFHYWAESGPLTFGCRYSGGGTPGQPDYFQTGEFFRGDVSRIAVFHRILGPSQIAGLFAPQRTIEPAVFDAVQSDPTNQTLLSPTLLLGPDTLLS